MNRVVFPRVGVALKEYSVRILSWEKYQNREVKNRTVWLRFQNDFIENPNFGEFTCEERIVWIYLLCCASRLNIGTLHVPLQCSHRVLHRSTGIDENMFHRAIEKLKKLRIVEVRTTRGCYAQDTSAHAKDTLRNEDEDETRTKRDETRRKKTPSGGLPAPSAPLPEIANPVGLFIGTYVKAFQARYGPTTRPNLAGKIQGQIKRFVAETPPDRACELIQVFCQMDDKWFTTKCHDFGTFLENLSKIGLALDTGTEAQENAPVDFASMLKPKEMEYDPRRI